MLSLKNIILLFATSLLMVSCSDPVSEAPQAPIDLNPTTAQDLAEINQDILDDPNNADNYHRRARYYFNNKQLEPAINDMGRALAIDSTAARFHHSIGEMQYVAGRVAEAKTSFEKCIAYDPVHVDALLKLGELSLVMREYQQALEFLNRALKEDQFREMAYYIKGFVFMESGDSAKAASSFKTAVELNADFYDAYIQLGRLYGAAREPMAAEYFNSAITIRPNETEAYYHKGMFCQENDMPDQAKVSYEAILQLDSKDVRAHHNLGYLDLIFFKEYSSAVTHFTNAIEIYPEYLEAWHNRGRAYEKLGNLENAKDNYRQALKIKPDYDLSALALGRVLGEKR